MVLNQKCQNKVKSYLCSSAAASAEQREGKRPDTQDSKQLSEFAHRMLKAFSISYATVWSVLKLNHHGRLNSPYLNHTQMWATGTLCHDHWTNLLVQRRQKFVLCEISKMRKTTGKRVGSSDTRRKSDFLTDAASPSFSLDLHSEGLIGNISSSYLSPEGCLTIGKHKYSSPESPPTLLPTPFCSTAITLDPLSLNFFVGPRPWLVQGGLNEIKGVKTLSRDLSPWPLSLSLCVWANWFIR